MPSTSRPTPPSRRLARALARAVGGVIAVGLAASTLSGCALVRQFTSHERERIYESWNDAPRVITPDVGNGGDYAAASDPDLRYALPDFVPSDATMIRLRITLNGPGDLVSFTSTTAIDPDACSPGTFTGSALLDTTWWPLEVPAEGLVCDSGWQVFDADGVTYGWLSE